MGRKKKGIGTKNMVSGNIKINPKEERAEAQQSRQEDKESCTEKHPDNSDHVKISTTSPEDKKNPCYE